MASFDKHFEKVEHCIVQFVTLCMCCIIAIGAVCSIGIACIALAAIIPIVWTLFAVYTIAFTNIKVEYYRYFALFHDENSKLSANWDHRFDDKNIFKMKYSEVEASCITEHKNLANNWNNANANANILNISRVADNILQNIAVFAIVFARTAVGNVMHTR